MSPKQGKWLDYILQVLDDAGGTALHESEIANIVIERGYPTIGKTPERTVNRVLNEHPDLFESVGFGRYRRRVEKSLDLPSHPSLTKDQDKPNTGSEPAGRRLTGQGFQSLVAVRQAIENHAMTRAIMYYEACGWQVEDVSSSQSFDLRCTRSTSEELRIEVKGTAGDGSAIILTANEVDHARAHYPHVELFIVSDILVIVEQGDLLDTSGGNDTVYQRWDVDAGVLTPITYKYKL